MKTTGLTLFAAFAITFQVAAQNSATDKIFEKYGSQDEFTVVDVAKGLFELFAEIEDDDPEFEEFQKAVAGIEKLRIIALDASDDASGKRETFYKDIVSSIPENDFKELMVVKEKDANIRFLAKYQGSVISEMLMVMNGNDETMLLSLTGNIDLKHLSGLTGAMKLKGMEHLEKLDQEEK